MKIQMVDLKSQYMKIKDEVDQAIQDCIQSSRFIGGPQVEMFSNELAEFLGTNHVITCGNGTDALLTALMALDLKSGDEVIVPAFTYAATAEVACLLGIIPIMVDVYATDFNIDLTEAEKLITKKTRAIIPVHLFGQSADMEAVLSFAKTHSLKVIEDNAQSIGAEFQFSDGNRMKTGTMGDIGTYSFFPAKNLGCFGDGGALSTEDKGLAEKIRKITTHGQNKKYYHQIVGLNSRLDTLQAAVLRVKLRYLDQYTLARQNAAESYNLRLSQVNGMIIPTTFNTRKHVYQQYTIRVKDGKRDALHAYLKSRAIPSTVYYPLPLYRQEAYKDYWNGIILTNTERLCKEVLSLPMHTELSSKQIEYITKHFLEFFDKN